MRSRKVATLSVCFTVARAERQSLGEREGRVSKKSSHNACSCESEVVLEGEKNMNRSSLINIQAEPL